MTTFLTSSANRSGRTTPLQLALLISTALALTACHPKKEAATADLPPSANVRIAVADQKTRVSNEDVVGTVGAKLRAAIEAKVNGRIKTLLVAPGQTVQAGDLIAEIDARELQAKLDQALAMHEQATRDLARARELMRKNVITQAEFDAVQARERVAGGSVSEMQTMLGYTRVVAPFNGVVTRQRAYAGDLATPGKPIIEMEDPGALRLEADVPEALIGNVKLGAKLPVRVGAGPEPIEGTVVEMAPVADAASRTFLVKLDLPPSEALRSGQFGRVSVATGETRTIRVPASAVVRRGQMETVFVASNDHVQLRIVRTGKRVGSEIELLSGINPGEKIVIEGTEQLRDGQPITIKP